MRPAFQIDSGNSGCGYAETADVRETRKAGAGRYVKKPFTLETIGLAVKAELEG